MGEYCRILEKSLLELLDPSSTPEKALKALTSSCFVPGTYKRDDHKPLVMFLAYMRYMITRLPDACIDGIWEDIFRKTIMFSKDSSAVQINDVKRIYAINVYPSDWLIEALSNPGKCRNPYSRLEIFRLIRIFGSGCAENMALARLCDTFIFTISEIQPHRLYPNGDENESLFHVNDFNYTVSLCCFPDTIKMISTDIINQIKKKKGIFVDNIETRFLSHCIQLIGVFAVMASSIPAGSIPGGASHCGAAFKYTIGRLVDCGDHLPKMSRQEQFRYIISHPPFRHYVIETIHDLTAAIINDDKMPDTEKNLSLKFLRYILAGDKDVCSESHNKTCNLPRLLLSRQLQGSTLFHQHSSLIPFLLRNLNKSEEECNDTDSDDTSNDSSDHSNNNSDY